MNVRMYGQTRFKVWYIRYIPISYFSKTKEVFEKKSLKTLLFIHIFTKKIQNIIYVIVLLFLSYMDG